MSILDHTVVQQWRSRKRATHANSFDGLRLLAALFVIIGHGYVLTRQGPAPRIGGLPLHALGVDVFFVISGYLISDSWLRDRRVLPYLARRVLRIFPALACLVVITVMIVGPMLTDEGGSAYFASAVTWAYLQNLALVGTYALPGVFSAGHWTTAVDGCLWTLGLEFIGYLVIALGRIFPNRRSIIPIAALLALGATLVVIDGTDVGLGAAGRVWAYFATGALARHLLSRTVFRLRIALPGAAAWMLLGLVDIPAAGVAAWVVIPYAVISVGERAIPMLRSAARFGDLSYGLYLWGFLVQQLVIERFGNLPVAVDLTAVLPVAVGIAWLSWHNVESPALARKPASPVRAAPTLLPAYFCGQ